MKLLDLQMAAKKLVGKIGNDTILPLQSLAFLTIAITMIATGIQATSALQFSAARTQTWVNDWGYVFNLKMMDNIELVLPITLVVVAISVVLRGALTILSNWPIARRYHDKLNAWAENGCAASAYELYLNAREQGYQIEAAAWLKRAADLGHKLAQEGCKA